MHGHKHIYNEAELFVALAFPPLPEHNHIMLSHICFSSRSFLIFSPPRCSLFFSDHLPALFLHSSELSGVQNKRLWPPPVTTDHGVLILRHLLKLQVAQGGVWAQMGGAQPLPEPPGRRVGLHMGTHRKPHPASPGNCAEEKQL